jgi:hypothetical protein
MALSIAIAFYFNALAIAVVLFIQEYFAAMPLQKE